LYQKWLRGARNGQKKANLVYNIFDDILLLKLRLCLKLLA
jgi:hypothetical protein